MRKSNLGPCVDVLTYFSLGTMREQETRRTSRSCIKISTAAGFAVNVVLNLTSLTRMMTPKLANEGSDENLLR